MRRGLIIIAVVTVGLTATAGTVLAQEAYPPGAAAQCPVSTIEPGGTVTCEAAGFAPGSEVTVEVLGVGFSRTTTVTADEAGVASATVQIPSDAEEGPVTITFEGLDAEGNFLRVAAASFAVVEAPAAEQPIPRTGADLTNGSLLALGLIVLGGGLVYGSRRRRGVDRRS